MSFGNFLFPRILLYAIFKIQFLNRSYHLSECFYFPCQNPTGRKGVIIKIYACLNFKNNTLCSFLVVYWQILHACSSKGSMNFVTYITHICHSQRIYLPPVTQNPDLCSVCHQSPCLLLSRLSWREDCRCDLHICMRKIMPKGHHQTINTHVKRL